LINSSPLGFKAWIAHVQGSNAILAQYDGNGSPSVFEYIYFRQLKFTTVCSLDEMNIPTAMESELLANTTYPDMQCHRDATIRV
jgi:hypothetical protein